jgi:DNA-binding transcriptional LysR family regulator
MILEEFGMGMTLNTILTDKFASGELIPLFEQHWCDIPNVYMYYARDSKQSLKVRTFLEFIQHNLN